MLNNTNWYKRILIGLVAVWIVNGKAQSPIVLTSDFKQFDIAVENLTWTTTNTTNPYFAYHQLLARGKTLKSKDINLHLGYKQPAAWVIFTLQNRGQDASIFLNVDNPSWDVLELYSVHNTRLKFLHKMGDTFPFAQRLVQHRDFLMPITVPKDSTVSFLLKLDRHGSYMNIGLSLWKKEQYLEFNDINSLIHGMYFGSVLIYMVFALMLFFMMKDWQYLFYTGWLFGFANVLASGTGFTFHYVHPHIPLLNGVYMVESEVFSIIMLILFTKRFLDTEKNLKILNTWLNIGIGIILGLTAIGLTFIEFSLKYRGHVVLLLNFIWISAIFSLFVFAIASYKKHPQKSIVFMAVFVILFSSILTFIGNSLGFIQLDRRDLVLILYGGSSAEIFLFSLSIALNVRSAILAHNKALVQIQEMQAELFDIERRTLSSERSRISLELHDHVANKLAVLLQQIRNGTIGQSEIDHDLNEITEDVRYLSHALSPFNEAADFEETLREWALHLQNKSGINIHIVNSASLDAISQELLVHIFRIIQEASSNSIKHGQAKNVFIQFMEHADSLSLSIEDDGIGFNPEVQTSGLGLKHIKARAQYLNAHFSIHSDANKGTFIQIIINQQPTQ